MTHNSPIAFTADPKRIVWSDDVPEELADTGITFWGTNARGDMVGVLLRHEDGTPDPHLVAFRADTGHWYDSRVEEDQWHVHWVLPVSRWPYGMPIISRDVKRTLRGRRPYRQADSVVSDTVRDFLILTTPEVKVA